MGILKLIAKSILLTVIAVCLLVFFFDEKFSKYSFYENTVAEFQKQEKIDIAIFGSSHAHSSYDPRILEVALAKNTFNFGGQGQRLVTTKTVIDLVCDKNLPSIAIIDVFSISLNEPYNDTYFGMQTMTYDALPFNINKLKNAPKVFGWKHVIWGLFPTVRNHASRSKKLFSKRKTESEHLSLDIYKGFRTRGLQFDDNTWTRFKTKYEARNNEAQIEELTPLQKSRIDEVITTLESKKVTILFVNAPSFITDFETNYKIMSKLVKDYVESKGIPFIDYNLLRDTLKISRIHFTDPNHLNSNGSTIVTQHLAKFIADSLKIEKGADKQFNQNRYFHIATDYKHVLFSAKIDSIKQNKLKGVKSAHLYKIGQDRYEITLPIASDTIGSQPLRFEYDITPKERSLFSSENTFFNKAEDKVYVWGTFAQKNVLYHENTYYVTFRFNSPLATLRNAKFYGGYKRSVLILDAVEIKLE